MLSIFPKLLIFEGFTPFLLRLTLGLVFILWSYKKIKSIDKKILAWGVFEGVIGVSFIIGFLTQLSALISAVIFGVKLIQKIRQKAFLNDGVNYYLILFVISITLLISGAGLIAIDLPL